MKSITIKILFGALVLFALPVCAVADNSSCALNDVLSCCDMPEPITSCCCACTLPKGTGVLRVHWDNGRTANLLLDGSTTNDIMDRDMRTTTQSLDMNFGLQDNLRLRVLVPYSEKKVFTNMNGSRIRRHSEGLGDVTTLLKWRLNTPKGSKPVFAVGAGVKFATGRWDLQDANGMLPMGLQLGTGTTDPIAGVWVSKKMLPWAFHAGYMQRWGQLNSKTGMRMGNMGMSNWTAAYVLSSRFNVLTEFNWRFNQRDKMKGMVNPNSGGTILYITPGVQYKGTDGTVLEAALQVPTIHKLHGTQMHPATTLLLGVSHRF